MAYRLITTEADLSAYVDGLEHDGVTRIAMDFEGEFNLHRYGMHLCLIQVFDGQSCVIIDPLALADPRSVGRLTEHPEIDKVMFDPSSDLSLIQNSLLLTITRIIDLQIAAALAGLTRLSLDAVLESRLGIPSGGKKSSQRANWMRRPLSEKLLDYAASDVLHLLEVGEGLLGELQSHRLLEDFHRRNDAYQDKDYRIDRSTQHMKLKGAKGLRGEQRIFLKHFWRARDNRAQRLDVPPARIMDNPTLIAICRRPPRSLSEWRRLKGTDPSFHRMIEAFEHAKGAAEQEIRHYPGRQGRHG